MLCVTHVVGRKDRSHGGIGVWAFACGEVAFGTWRVFGSPKQFKRPTKRRDDSPNMVMNVVGNVS